MTITTFWYTRPKPAYGRQGLDWFVGPGYNFVVFSTGRSNWPLWSKKLHVTDRGVQLTSFDPKNVTLPKGGSNWPPLIQKTWCHRRCGAPTDLLWSKKRYVTNGGIQLTSFDPKNVKLPTGGSNWPPLIQKTLRCQQGDPTDLLWSKKRYVTNGGIQLTSFDPKNVTLPTGGSNWPPLIQKTLRYQQGKPTDLLWSKKRYRYQQGDPTDLLDV